MSIPRISQSTGELRHPATGNEESNLNIPTKSVTNRRSGNRTKTALIFQLTLFTTAAIVPGLAILAYAYSAPSGDQLRVLGLSVLYGCAAATGGGLIGFLFGIPRSRGMTYSTESGIRTVDTEPTVTPNTSLPNTNLEQISDWLTKVLVGVTLVQIGKIGSGAAELFRSMSNALGTGSSGVAFVGALVTYSAAVGFMFGWLATRMWVAWAIAAVDISASNVTSKEPSSPSDP